MKRALGVMMLVLLACGPGADTPTADPAGRVGRAGRAVQDPKAAEKGLETLRDSFVWGGASQPAGDWDADAEACKGRVNEDPSIRQGAHPLAKVAALLKCMEEAGWVSKGENR